MGPPRPRPLSSTPSNSRTDCLHFLADAAKFAKLTAADRKEVLSEVAKGDIADFDVLHGWTCNELIDLLCSESGVKRGYPGVSKAKLIDHLLNIICPKDSSSSRNVQTSSLQQPITPNPLRRQRKGEHPSRLLTSTPIAPTDVVDNRFQQICDNSACRAVIKPGDTFCKRCSCCLCHQFDDNKDPSLWIACSDESWNGQNPCGLSCHLECALRHGIAGVVNIAGEIRLDGSYRCSSCGRVTGLIGCWRKQLLVAKDARRVDVLCQRLSLAHRLLDGTIRYGEQHEIVDKAAKKLEEEIGPLAEAASKCVRGIVSRLSYGLDVQQLAREALEAADLLQDPSENSDDTQMDSMVSDGVHFKDLSPTSVVLCWRGPDVQLAPDIQGYQIWHHKISDFGFIERPTCTLPKTERRSLISNLEPSTEYMFKVVAFGVNGEIKRFEACCSTKPPEIPFETHLEVEREARFLGTPENVAVGLSGNLQGILSGNIRVKREVSDSVHTTFKVRDLGKVVSAAWARKGESISGTNEGTASRALVRTGVRVVSESREGEAGPSQANGNRAGARSPIEANPSSTTQEVSRRHGNGAANGASVRSADLSLRHHFHGSRQPAAAENVDSGQGPEGTDDNPQIGLKHDMHDFEKFLPAGRVNNCGDSSGSTTSEENGYASTAAEAFHVRKAVQMTTGGLAAKEELSDGQLEAALLHSTDKGPKSEKYGELEIAVTESQQLGGPLNGSERVFEQCVRTIRWLEREGHLKAEFRRSFFTWLSLRATEAERKVVHIVMENMLDDPVALAAQLLDTFEEISAPKRLKVRH
ncbi:unnamed protein product [Sphagnum troendelagicum]